MSVEWPVPNATPFVGVPSVTASITTTGGPILVLVNANYEAVTGGATAFFSLSRNGTNIGHSTKGMQAAGPVVATYNVPVSIAYLDSQPAGTYTYSYLASSSQGTGRLNGGGQGPTSIAVMELKGANVASGTITSGFAVPNSGFTAITGLTANITPTKGPVLLIGSTNYQGTGGGMNWDFMSFFRGATNLCTPTAGTPNGHAVNVATTLNERLGQCVCYLDTAPTLNTTNTYTLQAGNGSGAGTVNEGGMIGQLIAIELNDVNWKFNASAAVPTLTTNTDFGAPGVSPAPTLSTRGRPVLLMANANANTLSSTARAAFTFLRNGASVTNSVRGLQISDGENNSDWNKMPTLFWLDTVPEGVYSYQAVGTNISSSTNMGQGGQSNIFMWELPVASGVAVQIGGWIDQNSVLMTTASVSIAGGAESYTRTTTKGLDVYFYVSGTTELTGSIAKKSVFGGDVVVSGSLSKVTPTFEARGFSVSLSTSGSTSPAITGSVLYSTTVENNQVLDIEAVVIGANQRGMRRSTMQQSIMRFENQSAIVSSSQVKSSQVVMFRGTTNEPSLFWTERFRIFNSGTISNVWLEVTGSGIVDWSANVSFKRQQTFATSFSSSFNEAPSTYNSYVLAWYRSDAMVVNGGAVTGLTDKSGNDRHLGQGGSTSLAPALETSVFNGHDSFTFNGTTQFLTGTIWNLAAQSGVGYMIFTVYSPTAWDGQDGLWDLSSNTLTNTYAHHLGPAGGGIRWGSSQVMGWTNPATGTPIYDTVAISTGSWERSEVWEKGVSKATTSTVNGGTKPINLRVGSLYQDVYYFAGKFAEIIICSGTLPTAARLEIEAYLASRYNIV